MSPPLTNPLQIRPMQTVDLEPVMAIDRASFSLPWPENAYKFELEENPLSKLWVAEISRSDQSKQLVGMIVIWLILDEVHIATLAVHPDFRRQGIAQELLSTAMDYAIQKGMLQATLEVRAGNHPAQSLYRQFGFNVAGQRHRYYQDNGEDAIIMTANQLDSQYLNWLRTRGWETIHSIAPAR